MADNKANVTVRIDANSFLLCDGEYMDLELSEGQLYKIQVPVSQHLFEFISSQDSDVKIEKEVDFPESGKSYLVLVKGLKEAVENANTPTAVNDESIKYAVLLKDAGIDKSRSTSSIKRLLESGLLEAKNLVDSAPVILKTGLSKEEAELWKREIEATGAKIDIFCNE
jgi:ribosomal protein L7/L12